MSIKQHVLDLLDFADREEHAFNDSLTDEERAFEGSFERWAAKDVLSHLYAWKVHFNKNVDRLKAGEVWETVTDVDPANAAIYETHHPKAWDVVRAEWAQANAGLRERAESLTEDQLTDPEQFPNQNSQRLWRRFAGNGIIHTALHLGEFYARRGEVDRANTLHETMVEMLLALDDSDDWQGITYYNLACHYAITGQPDAAITQLEKAFSLNLPAVEWSKQDPDLNSLRDLAAFQALYEAYPVAE